jgi:apolipoprotein N-acyltransferase
MRLRAGVAASWLLAALAGALTALGFEPWHWWPLVPVGVAVLTLLVRGARARRGAGLGAVYGVAFMLVLLPWLQVIGTPAWLALAVIEGLFYALVGAGTALVCRLPGWPLWAACTWVGAELLRGAVPFGGFPWGRLGHTAVGLPPAHLVGLVGTAGVTFAVALVGTVLAWALLRVRRRPLRSAVAVAAVCVLVSLPALAGTVLGRPDGGALGPDAGDGARRASGEVRVAVVQGNVPGVGLDAFAERRAVLDNHVQATLDLARRIAAGQAPRPDFVVWPENSSDLDPYQDAAARADIARAVRAVGVPLLMGSVVGGQDDSDGWRNRVIVWSSQGLPRDYYDKIHPVPFGEYIPLRSVLAPRIPALDQIPSDMVPGRRPGVLDVAGVRAGVLLCFEVGYDGLVRDLVHRGAELIVVPTNNATYTGTGQIEQQFAMSRLRARETHRSVVVASTNGISGIIGPDGDVLARAPVRTQAVLEARIPLSQVITPAMRFGAWIEGVLALVGLLAAAAGALVGMADRRRRAARGGPPTAVSPRPDAVDRETAAW